MVPFVDGGFKVGVATGECTLLRDGDDPRGWTSRNI